MTDRNRPAPEEMFRRLQQMQEDAERTLAKYEELSQELGTVAIEAYSDDGLVRVKLDADGRLAEIGIDEHAMRMRQSLSPTILAVIERAKAEYGVKMAEMAQALVGDKFDVNALVRGTLPEHMRDRFDR